MTKKVLFIDRDGTLVEEPPDCQVDALEKIRLVPSVIPSLLRLRDFGYRFVLVSNQDGLGSASFPMQDFERCQDHILGLFSSQGIEFDEIFICPHLPDDHCDCRKPATGLLTRFLASNNLNLPACAVIGDRASDLALAKNMGIRGLMLEPGGGYENTWPGICQTLTESKRSAAVSRKTRETDIKATVRLDEPLPVVIDTGIGFYDHMLEQIARHGNFSLQLNCTGDLHIDEHHTVEDTAICLGQAMREALGDKAGIGRYGFLLPMDESEAQVSIDLSGRAYAEFEGKFAREVVGGLPTELVPHFFSSFADALGAALHVRVRGKNSHHMIEACFKGVGRALRAAVKPGNSNGIPSTKGSLS